MCTRLFSPCSAAISCGVAEAARPTQCAQGMPRGLIRCIPRSPGPQVMIARCVAPCTTPQRPLVPDAARWQEKPPREWRVLPLCGCEARPMLVCRAAPAAWHWPGGPAWSAGQPFQVYGRVHRALREVTLCHAGARCTRAEPPRVTGPGRQCTSPVGPTRLYVNYICLVLITLCATARGSARERRGEPRRAM